MSDPTGQRIGNWQFLDYYVCPIKQAKMRRIKLILWPDSEFMALPCTYVNCPSDLYAK